MTMPKGVTAEFNRNLLRVLNRELQADFDPEDFDHVALFNREHEWIEMRLRARREHTTTVRDLGLSVHFEQGEEMRTEISAKFTRERVEDDLSAAGLEIVSWLTDPRRAVRPDALAPVAKRHALPERDPSPQASPRPCKSREAQRLS